MPETARRYQEGSATYTEGRDALAMQRETAATMARLVRGVSLQQLRHRPSPGKWSIVEILAHMAEDELASSWRYRQMIERDGQTLSGFDQDLWARLGSYEEWDAAEAIQLFRLLREANLRMFDGLSPEQWNRSGHHVERGKLTVRDLAQHMAAHDSNHIQQIVRLLAG